jgi:hypothetical protein
MCRVLERVVGGPATAGAAARIDRGEARDAGAAASAADMPCKDGDGAMTKPDETLTTELEAAAFRRLLEHLRSRTDVQNIDLMNLAGFCRNCLSNWYQEAAAERGVALTKDAAREIVYGMPYKEWQAKYQKEVSAEAAAAFEKSRH